MIASTQGCPPDHQVISGPFDVLKWQLIYIYIYDDTTMCECEAQVNHGHHNQPVLEVKISDNKSIATVDSV